MTRKLFGTDGVRGTANTHPMTAELALRLGQAAGKYFRNGGLRRHSAVIGKDTRLSGYMIENALTAGLTELGHARAAAGAGADAGHGPLDAVDAGGSGDHDLGLA